MIKEILGAWVLSFFIAGPNSEMVIIEDISTKAKCEAMGQGMKDTIYTQFGINNRLTSTIKDYVSFSCHSK